MAWTPTPAPALVVSASGPLQFREAVGEGELWTVEFPAARLAQPVESLAEPEAGLRRAWLAVSEAGSVRLVLELAAGVKPVVRALPAGVEVRLVGGERAPKGLRGEVEVVPVVEGGVVTVHIRGVPQQAGKAFTLENPPRVAVDVPGVLGPRARRVFPVGAAGVQRVRVAQFAVQPEPVVRIAVDLENPLKYTVEQTPDGLALRLGGGEEVVAASAPALPESVAAPVVQEQEADTSSSNTQATKAVPAVELAPPPAAPAAGTDLASQPPVPVASSAQPARTTSAAADSPYTSTPRAMAERAAPPPAAAAAPKEVETQERQFTGEPISLELKDADIKDVLRSFAKITGLNIVVDPDVSGSVTVTLENVPWDQCLDIILRVNRLDYVIENNVLRVARMERLTQEKQALANYQKQAEAARPMRTVTKVLSYARADDVKTILTAEKFIVSERGSVVVDPRSNMLIIRDLTDRIEGILNLVDELDRPNPQVLIEARIVETTRRFSYALGLQWGFRGVADAQHGTTTGWKFPNSGNVNGRVGLGIQGPTATIGFTFADILNAFNLDFVLQAAETNGLAKVVSAPKVMAQDNEIAKIESGIQIPIASTVTQGNVTTTTVTFKDATIKLEVTPHITAEGTVQLVIKLDKTEVLEGVNIIAIGTQLAGAPLSVRKAETKVLVRDGGTTVIGGVYKLTQNDQRNQVPGLAKIPVVGNLFKQRQMSQNNDELLIFLTPRIVKY
ncbi:MAG: type IV pilus secretin PilQ [Thermoanaerobaculum sp.]|nr:type IV pilus secretin PilQ [Thermoanaerobaculum sp.]MDW7968711.1 type IV pilus secretin PilQ [Thermoanaerobaculum sp.]